jgi:glycosyltransferase involved in cell wall biosynthesis
MQSSATTALAGNPLFTVIVLAYNSRNRVDIALRSLQDQDLDGEFEIVLVDSGTDGCAAYVTHRYPEVRIVRSPVRLWPGQARNQGLRAARGEFVAFLSDDTAAAPGWLSARLAVHRGGAQAVGGAITNGTPRSLIGTARRTPRPERTPSSTGVVWQPAFASPTRRTPRSRI